MTEQVILVNERDEVVGVEEKLKAHISGALHRAFSIFVFNNTGQLLLQRRNGTKYHSGGLWSNTCCGHPQLGESIKDASRRRLREEMGFGCELRECFQFIYQAEFSNGLFEHEYDHVLVGEYDGTPYPNGCEVDDWKWADLMTLRPDVQENPEKYTYWFRISLEVLCNSRRRTELGFAPIPVKWPTMKSL